MHIYNGFNEEDGTLTVTVPKKGTEISGLNIEEEEETEEKQSKIFFLKKTEEIAEPKR